MTIMDKLEDLGYTFSLNIAVSAPATPPAEAAPLLSKLAAERDTTIEELIARHLGEKGPVPLPDDTPIPIPWEAELAFKRVDNLILDLLGKAQGVTDDKKADLFAAQDLAELWALNPKRAREKTAGMGNEQQRIQLN